MCQTHLRDAGGMRTGGLKRLGPCRTSVTHGHHQQGHQADDEVCTAGERERVPWSSDAYGKQGAGAGDGRSGGLCSPLLSPFLPVAFFCATGTWRSRPGPVGRPCRDRRLRPGPRQVPPGVPARGPPSGLREASCLSQLSSRPALAARPWCAQGNGFARVRRFRTPEEHVLPTLWRPRAQKAHFSVSSHLAGSNEVVITLESGCSGFAAEK